jgi:uncharacterized membrane protein YbhN (UPF0104 family)
VRSAVASIRAWTGRHPVAVTVACTLAVTVALVLGLWDKRDDFAAALSDASVWILASAAALQVVWLIARSEAWHVCVGAAGGAVGRRRLYRASAVGYLGNLFNSHFGMGVRIAALRRSAPTDSPNVSTLITAEMPIIVIEVALAAICSFTLIGPLGLPWWAPVIFLAVALGVVIALTRLANGRREGFWAGLGVMRGLGSRNTIVALVMFATGAQVVRNWVVLQGLGVDVSVLDSVALLIGAAVVGLFPVGPTLGVATAVLILGSNGIAVTAAAGALLTATGAAGALCFAGWALLDRMRPSSRRLPVPVPRRAVPAPVPLAPVPVPLPLPVPVPLAVAEPVSPSAGGAARRGW